MSARRPLFAALLLGLVAMSGWAAMRSSTNGPVGMVQIPAGRYTPGSING